MKKMFDALFGKYGDDSMVRVFEGRKFECFYDRGGHTFSNLEFLRCLFESCAISITTKPHKRSIVRKVRLIKCEQIGSVIDTAIVEDVIVDGLKTHGLLQCWGAVFKHVVLKGNIGRIMISPFVSPGWARPKEQRAFDEANAAYYANVDWALDISQGRFEECEIQRVPAHLVIRDPETQVVVKKEKALEGKWRQLNLSKTHWKTSIEFFLERGDPDVVLVAPKRNSKYPDLLDGLKMLRDAGVAEPD